MNRLSFRIEPLDQLFFRDGKPFSESIRAEGGLPMPQTLTGAVRTALMRLNGCDFDKIRAEANKDSNIKNALLKAGVPKWIINLKIKGPWLIKNGDLFLPTPMNLSLKETKENPNEAKENLEATKENKKEWRYRLPLYNVPEKCWTDNSLKPLWRYEDPQEKETQGKAEYPGGYISILQIAEYLKGNNFPCEYLKPDELYLFEERTGIAIDSQSLTAAESQIYGIRMLRLLKEVFFYFEIETDADAEKLSALNEYIMPWGGEARRALLKKESSQIEFPSAQPNGNKNLLLYLTTPAIFDPKEAWKPDFEKFGLKLVSAAVGDPIPVSGWDFARGGPKPTRFAAPAGSVYFCEIIDPQKFKNAPQSLCNDDWAELGYGLYLKGTWNYIDK